MKIPFIILGLSAGLVGPSVVHSESDNLGFVVFRDNCIDCHLSSGWGIREMGAPSIAGLPRWYVTDQLRKFRREERGGEEGDATGRLMQVKAMALGEMDLIQVAKYIESLAPRTDRGLTDDPSDPTAGGRHYRSACASCHGEDADGSRAERAPPLTRQPAWYLLKQLENFRLGRRLHFSDETLATVSPEKEAAIVAWIAALPLKGPDPDGPNSSTSR